MANVAPDGSILHGVVPNVPQPIINLPSSVVVDGPQLATSPAPVVAPPVPLVMPVAALPVPPVMPVAAPPVPPVMPLVCTSVSGTAACPDTATAVPAPVVGGKRESSCFNVLL